jgi:hypothetical protein
MVDNVQNEKFRICLEVIRKTYLHSEMIFY